jgi:hypothetical protein
MQLRDRGLLSYSLWYVFSLRNNPNLPMMIICASARWKLPTKASASADKQWLFLIFDLHT